MSSSSSKPLEFGVVLLSSLGVQLLDISPVDLCSCMSPWYMTACGLPDSIASKGVNFNFHYISEHDGQPLESLTAGMRCAVTDTLESCPPDSLDVMLIGGPEPGYQPDEKVQTYLRKAMGCEKLTILMVCTGLVPMLRTLGARGSTESVLSGHSVTAPRPLVKPWSEKHRSVRFVEKRWQKDEKKAGKAQLWSSGGSLNGMDMMAAFMRDGGPKGEWAMDVVETALGLTDVGWRKQDYEE